MSRLASLSTPTRSRSSQSPTPDPSPSPVPRETTHHRMLKLVLAEINTVHRTWDDLVGVDGLKAGKGVTDESTTMDNLLTVPPNERPPIGDHYRNLHASRAALQGVINKLYRLLGKLSLLMDQAEKLYLDAYRLQGPEWVEEPLWLSWSFTKFIDSLPRLIHLHSQHLHSLLAQGTIILASETTFDAARVALERWRDLSMGGERWDGVREWEELVELEMTLGGEVEEDDGEEEGHRTRTGTGTPNGGKKGKKRR